MSDKNHQMQLFETQAEYKIDGLVECLGQTFENDAARRAHFIELLRQKLQDPEFRQIEGFPIGEDEDILALSDPPYYTACPNPWLADFMAEWEAKKPKKPMDFHYRREPFAADVSEGKNNPIYNAHSYHTKVPHKAIMRYILHYTEPGDIVFDGFCGTGMTGVAAQMCGNREVVESLDYRVEADGTILQQEPSEEGKKRWVAFSKLGARHAMLNDLSPAATFIAYNYNTPVDVATFEKEAKRILEEVEKEYGWMYETHHTDGQVGKINYTVWSDVFICLDCSGEVIYFFSAIDQQTRKVKSQFECPHCGANLKKHELERKTHMQHNPALDEIISTASQYPVLINYTSQGRRLTKEIIKQDLSLSSKIEQTHVPYKYPMDRIDRDLDIWYERDYRSLGLYSIDGFFTRRNLYWLAAIFSQIQKVADPARQSLLFTFTGCVQIASRMSSFRYDSRNPKNTAGGILKGALYIPSISKEGHVADLFNRRHRAIVSQKNIISEFDINKQVISTGSSTKLVIGNNSLDYIFLDPPFGSNIIYSELSLFWEAWLGVYTNDKKEAVVHRRKKSRRKLAEYYELMQKCFLEAYRVLKPGHWLTVEFSNTKANVWNSIQHALQSAGFVVANVSALDKKTGSFRAVTTPTAVKQDLVISAYKPNGGFEERFLNEATSEDGVWDFVRTHLSYLPVIKRQNGSIQMVPERDPRILFDRMVAYYVRKGYPVPLSSQEFQLGLTQRFSERDGMYFLPAQAAEYDRKKINSGKIIQATIFVDDESSAIQWLRQLLNNKPQTSADINPQFMQQLGGWRKNEAQLDLRELLQQNFLSYDGKGPVPEQIHAYLSSNWKDMRNLPKDDPALVAKAKDRWYVPDPNKQADLDKLRERSLLREFETYKESKKKRLKLFRLEAVRAGFQKAWQAADYDTILAVTRKIPPKILQEDPKLLMWYDMSLTRTGQTE